MTNIQAYEQKYKSGYGLKHPDGHFIRVITQIVEYQEKVSGGAVLDYGCGNGTHLRFLLDRWKEKMVPFGLDVSPDAISEARRKLRRFEQNLQVCAPQPDIAAIFSGQRFDLIVANQVLYYLDDPAVATLLRQFWELLKPNGLIVVSWMGVENFYYALSEEIANSSLRTVSLAGRLTEQTFVNFKDRAGLLKLLGPFTKLHYGYYDSVIREDEGSTMHYLFVGKKVP